MYTSRLPVSTVRRPTSHADGSTSYVGLNRPSNIPVTVRKANLFTPQTKRPFQNAASTAGKSFTSGMTTDKKYKRALKPAPDLETQRRMYDNLVEYIKSSSSGIPIPDARKFFSSLSTTETARIFEFLLSREIPDFKINRLEIDVPAALARLDYPFIRSVTKSALVSVTTRQASVGLLVIFDWLVRLIKDYEEPDLIEEEDVEDEGLIDEQNEIAKHVLMHPDDSIRAQFDRVFPTITLEEVQEKLEEPSEEYERLAADLEEIRELDQEVLTLREDSSKCIEYNTQMRKYLECKRQEKQDAEQQEMKTELQIEEITRRETETILEIKNHELNIDDVKKDQSILSRYEIQLATVRKQNDEIVIEKETIQQTNQRKEQQLMKMFQDKSDEFMRRLRKDLDKLARDFENEKQQCMDTLAKAKTDSGDSRRYMQQYQDNEQTKVELCNEIDRLKDQLCKTTEDTEAIEELGKEYSARLEERLNLEMSNILKDTKNLMYSWDSRRQVADHNHTVAKTAFKFLKKRLDLA